MPEKSQKRKPRVAVVLGSGGIKAMSCIPLHRLSVYLVDAQSTGTFGQSASSRDHIHQHRIRQAIRSQSG